MCDRSELRLDHDPPLALRPQHRKGLGRKTYYVPDANDPEHLKYRPHGPQHDGSHDVKTRVRGDHGQFSDLALIRREKRRLGKAERKPKPKWAKRGKKSTTAKARFARGKTRWPKRKFPRRRD